MLGIHVDNKSIWHLVVSDYLIQQDGTILVYAFSDSQKNGEFIHIDCRLNYATIYWNNFANSQKTNGTSVADNARQFFCFNEDDKGEKFLAYGGYLIENKTNFNSLGWYPDKTKKNGNEHTLTAIAYRISNGKFYQYIYDDTGVKLNCIDKTVTANSEIFHYNKNGKHYDFLIDTACRNNNFLGANGFQYTFDNDSKTSTGIDKDSIKQTCRDLGFSEGTDKYGECVLQLLEELD